MKNAAIFPFTGTALPVVRHFENLQSTYRVSQVISWKGAGLGGKDAAYIYNHPMVGVPAVDIPDALDTSWDMLLVDCSEAENPNSSMDRLEFFQKSLAAGKEITFIADEYQEDKYPSELQKIYPNQVKIITASSSTSYDFGNIELYSPVSVPTLMIGGLIDRSDTLEIVLALKEEFLADKRTVSCIVGSNLGLLVGAHSYQHIFENTFLSEERKILQLNQLAQNIIRAERPDLMLVEAPDAVVKYNTIIPNGFGIRTYMAVQAINPDLFICSVPCDLAFSAFLDSASEGINHKYGFPISAVHASNAMVDSAELVHEHKPVPVHADMKVVARLMESNTKGTLHVYDTISQGAGCLYHQICEILEESAV